MCDVLILEDDPLLRMLFAHAISGEGFIVREAGSVAEAWTVLRQPAEVRVLLADKDLGAPPGEPDGFVVAAKALQLHPALVVIYAAGSHAGHSGKDNAKVSRRARLQCITRIYREKRILLPLSTIP